MKLSKVKKICMKRGTIICAQAETGLDRNSWIGTNEVMYPVRELVMTAELACKLWEVESKKLQDLYLSTNMKSEHNTGSRIIEDLEAIPYLGDSEGDPYIRSICKLDSDVILFDSKLNKVYSYSAELLAPIEGGKIKHFRMGDWIGIYGNGLIEAAVWCQEPSRELLEKLNELCLAVNSSGISVSVDPET